MRFDVQGSSSNFPYETGEADLMVSLRSEARAAQRRPRKFEARTWSLALGASEIGFCLPVTADPR